MRMGKHIDQGIRASNAISDVTIKNVTMTEIQWDQDGIQFANTATNINIDSFFISGGPGGAGEAIVLTEMLIRSMLPILFLI